MNIGPPKPWACDVGDVAREVGWLSKLGNGIVPPRRGLLGGEPAALLISDMAAFRFGDPMGDLVSEGMYCACTLVKD